MKIHYTLTLLLICLVTNVFFAQISPETFTPDSTTTVQPTTPMVPEVFLMDYDMSMEQTKTGGQLVFNSPNLNGRAKVMMHRIGSDEEDKELRFIDGKAVLDFDTDYRGGLVFLKSGSHKDKVNRLYHVSKNNDGTYRLRHIPLWLSLVPPLVAIALALIFKEVIVSLFIGIWAGAFIAGGLRVSSFYYFLDSFFGVIQNYVISALADADHLSIIVFSLLIGGMVAIISRNGGMAGVVQSLSKYAKSPRSSQFITWLLGVAIFFDDYANTLIVGNTMRSVTDKFKVSREKLAYIVDSTAAPVSAVAFITTWIGAELSYIDGATATLPGFDTGLTPYSIFISSLKYSFYPILTLIFILIIIYTQRDYGAMHKAETRARTTGRVSSAATEADDEPDMEDLSPVAGAPLKWYNAFLPVLAVILMTLYGLVDTGIESLYGELADEGHRPKTAGWVDVWAGIHHLTDSKDPSFFMKMGKLIGSSNSYVALIWASFTGVLLAIILTVGGRIMKLHDTMHTMVTGFKTMLPALIILTLAWSLAITTGELHTADYLTSISQGNVSPYMMPVIIFILAAFIAFSTGSSWSTMAILYPIAIPTTWAICQGQGLDPDITMELLYNVIAIVLAASVVGDHCSPISDTTILSSLASDCNHIDHVRTQLPYALTVGTISLIAGYLVTFFGGGLLMSLLLIMVSVGLLFGIVMVLGKKVD